MVMLLDKYIRFTSIIFKVTGRFAYGSFRLRVVSPTGRFAYGSFRLRLESIRLRLNDESNTNKQVKKVCEYFSF